MVADDGGEENEEILSVYDVTIMWALKGRDEDYTFGYTEKMLSNSSIVLNYVNVEIDGMVVSNNIVLDDDC